ncbi:MAG: Bax inhibitor-1/YccA family protein [Sphingomonas sp.]|uniref:Bax inhibitor-1/YccA family protein n=1 Tax=Sphingomonas sp. TaxID=28214 RepID=UPI002618F06B|nr:Bax inhibitor-1/YccA family protein [Sphingomonas sp.]MDK2766360.1 Bax inhibitor-1/YccA family protein [Sphingomonas sp.]
MANWSDPHTTAAPYATAAGTRDSAAYDAGLRSYMLSVYNYMASGVLLSGIVALMFAWGGSESIAASVFANGGPLVWLIILSPLAIVFAMSFGQNKFSTGALQGMFWAFTVLMGLSLSTLLLRYEGASVAQAFFAAAAGFAGLSLYGYTTKRDLSGFGSFLIVGLIGLIVASIINIFLKAETLAWIISIAGVLIFAGLTAYDTQRIKSVYQYVAGTDMVGKAVIMGALNLYLDFINMFQFILSIIGNRE